MAGFFTDIAGDDPEPIAAQCGKCKLDLNCADPYQKPTGRGDNRILIIGDAPGHQEAISSQSLLENAIKNIGRNCWKTNAVICRPQGELKSQNVKYCRPNLTETIKKLQPHVIIPMGSLALESVLMGIWRKPGAIGRWAGFQIPCRSLNAWICPTWHPTWVAAQRRSPVVRTIFDRHLTAAAGIVGRPWDALPDDAVECETDPERAVEWIDQVARHGRRGAIAFDYETNMLKPDGDDASIYSASIAWGVGDRAERCMAFPWIGGVPAAMSRLLRSPIPKIAANLKFEERWTLAEFGHGVVNWAFDTMQGGHLLDCRRGITGLTFQAFVGMGVPVYDSKVAPFLKSNSSRKPNRIDEVPMLDLLQYNALDSLYEYEIAFRQAPIMKVKI